MNKIKFLISALCLTTMSFAYSQTNAANFSDESAIWQKTNNGFVSTFTVEVSADGLAEIKEKYNDLGSSVSYRIISQGDNSHTIVMTFNSDVPKMYLHKMLIYIGCENVFISGQKMSLDELANFLSH
jgi:hypothetical protein